MNGTGNYGFGDTIIINLPTRANLCLNTQDSYLKFNVAFTNGATAANSLRWDSCGAHGLFQRLRIFSGSNLLLPPFRLTRSNLGEHCVDVLFFCVEQT